MAKIELKGTIVQVCDVETVGEKSTKKQNIILKVLGYTDEFGDKKSDDEIWQLSLMGNRITKFDLQRSHELKKAKVTAYVSSRMVVKDGGAAMYFISANIGDITIV